MQINVNQYENHRYIDVEQIVDRSTKHVCTRCFKNDFNKFEFVFVFCMINKKQHEICENCFFKHKIMTCFLNKCLSFELYSQLIECSINFMRLKKFEIVKIVFSINAAFSTNFTDEKKKTKKFVRNRENDILTIDFFLSRFRNIKRRRLFFFLLSSTNAKRERLNNDNSIDESINNRVKIIEFESFFVFQNEHENENENVFLSNN